MRNDLVYLIRQFKDILEGFFRGQFLIGAMMGIGYAIGFSISGLKFGMALGLFFGVLNVVPYLAQFSEWSQCCWFHIFNREEFWKVANGRYCGGVEFLL